MKFIKTKATQNNLHKLEAINTEILNFAPMGANCLNFIQLKEKLSISNYYSKFLHDDFFEYGCISNDILGADFFNESTKNVVRYSVRKQYNTFKVFAFLLAADNFLSLQKAKMYLLHLENKNII